MRINILLCSLALAPSLLANTVESVFARNSPLPRALQTKILQRLQANCQSIITEGGLQEATTGVREEHVDQYIFDYFYTTTLATRYQADGIHPSIAYITVESAEYAVSNPDMEQLQILSVSSNTQERCD